MNDPTPAYALRMKSGHWVGIWNDRATAEHMRSRYRDGDKYEIVEFPVPAVAAPAAEGVAEALQWLHGDERVEYSGCRKAAVALGLYIRSLEAALTGKGAGRG